MRSFSDKQQQRDQVAGDDEEHFDAQEAAAEPFVIGVIDEHGRDRDGAQTIETRKIRDSADLVAERRVVQLLGNSDGGGRGSHSSVQYRPPSPLRAVIDTNLL